MREVRTGLVGLVLSGVLLAGLYRSLNLPLVGEALLGADRAWLAISVGMIVPITLCRAVRFFWIAPAGALRGVGEALRLTLAASALNVFLPAKSGDLIKSYVVARGRETATGVAVAMVVYERLADLFGLIFWCVLGWLVARPQGTGVPSAFWLLLGGAGAVCAVLVSSERAAAWSRGRLARTLPHGGERKAKASRHVLSRLRELAAGWPDLLRTLRGHRPWIVLFSVVLWLVQLWQIWLFTVALSVDIPFMVCASLSAVALMAGQLPFTFAGLGTRDLALVLLLSPYMAPESAAAMGILIATRSLLPPLLGLPVMGPYVSSVIQDARRWRREMAPQ